MPGVDPKLVDFFKLGADGATIGVPYAVYPSYLYFNKDLFDEAGLPYPPTKVGDLYQGKPWDMDAVRTLGMKLTVDARATTPPARTSIRRRSSSGASTCSTPTTARWPSRRSSGRARSWPPMARPPRSRENVSTGEKWYNDGVWKDHFIPSAAQISSDLLDKGNEFESGNLAMNESHTWFTCCVYPAAPAKPKVK